MERALRENAELLPIGLSTPRMLLLRGIDDEGERVGRACAGLDRPRGVPDTAFLYDIEITEHRRGTGPGTARLAAVEGAVLRADRHALELNVFGHDHAAVHRYRTAGCEGSRVPAAQPRLAPSHSLPTRSANVSEPLF